jgi:hypothetical protein
MAAGLLRSLECAHEELSNAYAQESRKESCRAGPEPPDRRIDLEVKLIREDFHKPDARDPQTYLLKVRCVT